MDKIFSPIKERIIYFIEKQSLTKESFFNKTGISASNFMGSGAKSEIGGDKLVKILTTYPEINPEWLITGYGDMLRVPNSSQQVHAEGDQNIAIAANGKRNFFSGKNVANRHAETAREVNILNEKVKHLEQLLEEKERLIKVLMEKR